MFVPVAMLCVSREQEDREERERLRKEGKPLPPELLREGACALVHAYVDTVLAPVAGVAFCACLRACLVYLSEHGSLLTAAQAAAAAVPDGS